jgi:hypothetical protein
MDKHLFRVSIGTNRYVLAEDEDDALKQVWEEINDIGVKTYFEETGDVKLIDEAEGLKEE